MSLPHYLNYPHIPILILTWLITILLLPLIIRFSGKMGALDQPGGHKAHANAVSFLGGVAIFISFVTGIVVLPKIFDEYDKYNNVLDFITHSGNKQLFGIAISGAIVFILGLVDDYKHLNAILKLFAILATTLLLNYFGIAITLFSEIWMNVLVTVLWIAGVTSACNSLDHVDGATAGTSAISAFFIFLIAWYAPEPQRWLSFVAAAVLGSSLGFLLYNFNPAKIYLGDNGAFFLGYTLSAMAILGGWSESPVKSLLIPGLLMAAPIYDIVLSTILRYKNNVVRSFPEAILYCGQDHSTHRMMAHGLSKNVSVYVLYAINIMGGLIALSGLVLKTPGFICLVGLFVLGLCALGKWLDECPKSKLYKQ